MNIGIYLDESERDLVIESLYELRKRKVEAFEMVEAEMNPRIDKPFTERDFGIPQIDALIDKLEGA